MIGLHGMLTTGSRNGLGRTRLGGFFYGRRNVLAAGTRFPQPFLSASIQFRRSTFGDFCAQLQ